MKKLILVGILVAFTSILFISCDSDTVPPEQIVDETNNGFETFEVAEIFASNCATSGCHMGNSQASGLTISNYSELLKGSRNRSNGTVPNYGGEDVIAFNSSKSLVYQFITNNVTPIAPHDVISLSQDQITAIKLWIDNGAKDFNKNSPFLNPTYRVYVCNQGSDVVSVIDGDAKVVSALIDVDFLQNPDKPHMVKERDGFIYVTLISFSVKKFVSSVLASFTGNLTFFIFLFFFIHYNIIILNQINRWVILYKHKCVIIINIE